jgi:hypothetical protein
VPCRRWSWRQRRGCVSGRLPRTQFERASARRTEPALLQPWLDATEVKAVGAATRHAYDALALRHHLAADWQAHLGAANGALPVLGQRFGAKYGAEVAQLRQLGVGQGERQPDGTGAACADRRRRPCHHVGTPRSSQRRVWRQKPQVAACRLPSNVRGGATASRRKWGDLLPVPLHCLLGGLVVVPHPSHTFGDE